MLRKIENGIRSIARLVQKDSTHALTINVADLREIDEPISVASISQRVWDNMQASLRLGTTSFHLTEIQQQGLISNVYEIDPMLTNRAFYFAWNSINMMLGVSIPIEELHHLHFSSELAQSVSDQIVNSTYVQRLIATEWDRLTPAEEALLQQSVGKGPFFEIFKEHMVEWYVFFLESFGKSMFFPVELRGAFPTLGGRKKKD